jgi:hypothetical protein
VDLGFCSSNGSPASVAGSGVVGEFFIMSLPSITFLIWIGTLSSAFRASSKPLVPAALSNND